MLAFSIQAALKAKIFERVIVSTNSQKFAKIARYYGAEVPFLRPNFISKSYSSDYEWVKYTINELKKKTKFYTFFYS